jgi:uncharacterized membrane protein YgcG
VATGDLRKPGRRARHRIDAAVARAEAHTGLQLCVVLGAAGDGDPRARAEAVFADAGLIGRPAVLVVVDPTQRHVEIVTGPRAVDRITDDDAAAAVAAMTARFRSGALAGGLEAALEQLAAAAGPGRPEPGDEDIANVVGGGA